MAKKKTAAGRQSVPAAAKAVHPAASAWNHKEIGGMALLVAGFFLLVCFTVPGTIKPVAIMAALGAAVVALLRRKTLRERLTWPAVLVCLWVVMEGASTLYAVSGKFALDEFLKVYIGFCVFLTLLCFCGGDRERAGRRAASMVEGCTALAGLFSIDLISTRVLSSLFFALMGLFTENYKGLTGIEAGVRMTSIFENPNAFAGCVGLGTLLSLALAVTAREKRERRLHLVCLAANALSFVLAFSMGASATIALAFLAYLFLERRERRPGLLVLMVETFVLTVAASVPVYLTAFGVWDGMQPWPLVSLAALAAALCVLDEKAGSRLAARLEKSGKAVALTTAAVLGLVAVYGVLAFNVAGPAELKAGEGLTRSAYPDEGSYTLSVEADGPLSVTVWSQDLKQTMMHANTTLYAGAADGAAFTVPEGSVVVYFSFSAAQDTEFWSASYEGENGSGSLKLGYRLIPGFMANRLQGLFANQNAIQRTVFFDDGLKLFRRSPVFGLGMGAFENGVMGVQSFYYETKYAHNHYIQTLVETGLAGFALFIGMLGTLAAAVLKSRRREDASPLTAALGAALVFMAGHAAVEIVFSRCFNLSIMLSVFGLICVCCGDALPLPEGWKPVRNLAPFVVSGLVAFYAVLVGCNIYAKAELNEPSIESLETAISIDPFEWADYMLTYVYYLSAQEEELDPLTRSHMEAYLTRLERLESNTTPIYLAEAYFNLGRTEKAFEMLGRYADRARADSDAWTSIFSVIMSHGESTEEFYQGVRELYQRVLDFNAQGLGEITLEPTTKAYAEYIYGLD